MKIQPLCTALRTQLTWVRPPSRDTTMSLLSKVLIPEPLGSRCTFSSTHTHKLGFSYWANVTHCTTVIEFLSQFPKLEFRSLRNIHLKHALIYRRSPHFVIFGTKKESRNWGIPKCETFFSTNSQIGSKSFLKSTFLAFFHKISFFFLKVIISLYNY